MGTPLKIKIRRFFKELKCPHKGYIVRRRSCGLQEYNECECCYCGKVWVE